MGLDADGLPDIDWVDVPAGEFLFGDDKRTERTDAFRIARYPVTNAQYQAFIDAGGYRDERWWKGPAERVFYGPTEPNWTQPNRPRTVVSWFQAVAFCRWLSAQLGLEIRLPTEIEWEKAARGTDGREYPWGDGYRPGFANVDETEANAGSSSLAQTTAVGVYPHVASPCGARDLAGNVWEWCINDLDDNAGIERKSDADRAGPQDYVRTEIEIALARGIPVIPVLLRGVTMPREADLPPSIAAFAYRHAVEVDAGAGFRLHMDRLVRGLERSLGTGATGEEDPKPERAKEEPPKPTPRKPRRTTTPDGPTEEVGRLLDEIDDPQTPPKRRLAIGDRLAELGDPRPGVGLGADGLPDIDCVDVPAGGFLFREKNVSAFVDAIQIARYPITNAQYQAFIDSGGYREGRWWKGLAQRVEKPAVSRWSQPNRPRTDVSWFEAVAFCRWLSAALGMEIRLPTETEWEKAARGTDGREYPWGNGYRPGFANIDETHRERRTELRPADHGGRRLPSRGLPLRSSGPRRQCLGMVSEQVRGADGHGNRRR